MSRFYYIEIIVGNAAGIPIQTHFSKECTMQSEDLILGRKKINFLNVLNCCQRLGLSLPDRKLTVGLHNKVGRIETLLLSCSLFASQTRF